MNKDLICLKNLSKQEIEKIFDTAIELKKNKGNVFLPLANKTIAMIFTKPSNRTRVSFEVGIVQLGGYPVYLGPKEIRLGERETFKDAAKVLSRYVDGIVIRTFKHKDVLELSKHADVPVINGLCDMYHPCQILADLLTIKEKIGLENKKIVYVGDGNNIVHSWLYASAILGLNFIYSTPLGYKPDANVVKEAQEIAHKSGAKIEYIENPKQAAVNADIIYTDVWASMGHEKEKEKREKDFADYQVNDELMSYAKPNCLFMHCLPAYRGVEVTDSVLDGANSVVYDEAENRLHVQKAVLALLVT